jgi:hypothetical protein
MVKSSSAMFPLYLVEESDTWGFGPLLYGVMGVFKLWLADEKELRELDELEFGVCRVYSSRVMILRPVTSVNMGEGLGRVGVVGDFERMVGVSSGVGLTGLLIPVL